MNKHVYKCITTACSLPFNDMPTSVDIGPCQQVLKGQGQCIKDTKKVFTSWDKQTPKGINFHMLLLMLPLLVIALSLSQHHIPMLLEFL